MSAPTNTEITTSAKGIREDLSNLIFRVAAEQTPLLSNIGRAKAKQTYHEYQTETLAAPNPDNAALEGGDVGTLGTPNRTARVGNICQIFTKDGGVSGTVEEVDKAGRDSELARQKLLKGKEAMRDLEMRAIGNYASQAESDPTPRKMAGVVAHITTNVSRGSGGSDGGFGAGIVSAATNGTQRTFTEDQLKDVMALAFTNGAKPSQAYMTAANKQDFSSFTGISDIRTDAGKGQKVTIMGAADFYQSDFGIIAAIPHPYGLLRDALFADPDYIKLATLRPWKTQALAKTGDNEKFQLVGEFTIEVGNELAHAVVADLNQ